MACAEGGEMPLLLQIWERKLEIQKHYQEKTGWCWWYHPEWKGRWSRIPLLMEWPLTSGCWPHSCLAWPLGQGLGQAGLVEDVPALRHLQRKPGCVCVTPQPQSCVSVQVLLRAHDEAPLSPGSLGWCPQLDPLWPHLTVLQHLEAFAAVRGMREEDAALAISW